MVNAIPIHCKHEYYIKITSKSSLKYQSIFSTGNRNSAKRKKGLHDVMIASLPLSPFFPSPSSKRFIICLGESQLFLHYGQDEEHMCPETEGDSSQPLGILNVPR